MSILIKGMEMPKNCYVCPFCDYVSARCDAVKGTPYTPANRYEKRADFCPLVSVPSHGDLIDRDALIVELMDRGVEGLQTDDWHEIQQAVADAPTIIPAEEGDT